DTARQARTRTAAFTIPGCKNAGGAWHDDCSLKTCTEVTPRECDSTKSGGTYENYDYCSGGIVIVVPGHCPGAGIRYAVSTGTEAGAGTRGHTCNEAPGANDGRHQE